MPRLEQRYGLLISVIECESRVLQSFSVPHAITLWEGGVGPGFHQFLTSYSEASSRERQSVSGYRLDLLR